MGPFHSPPLDAAPWGLEFVLSSTEHFLCSCPHPRQADCGCRPGFPLGSHFHLVEVGFLVLRIYLPRISYFPDSGPLLHEGHLQALLFCFSLSGSTGFFIRMPWIPFWIKCFSLQFCLPSSGTHAFLFKRIVRFRGAMLLIVPLNLNSTWILIPAFPGGSFFSSSLCVKR